MKRMYELAGFTEVAKAPTWWGEEILLMRPPSAPATATAEARASSWLTTPRGRRSWLRRRGAVAGMGVAVTAEPPAIFYRPTV